MQTVTNEKGLSSPGVLIMFNHQSTTYYGINEKKNTIPFHKDEVFIPVENSDNAQCFPQRMWKYATCLWFSIHKKSFDTKI